MYGQAMNLVIRASLVVQCRRLTTFSLQHVTAHWHGGLSVWGRGGVRGVRGRSVGEVLVGRRRIFKCR